MTDLMQQAREIFAETLRAVDVRRAVEGAVACYGRTVRLGEACLPCSEIDEVVLIAVGKAALAMYEGAERSLNGRIPVRAVVVAPESAGESAGERSGPTVFLSGAHPYPDLRSRTAASAALNLLETVTGRSAVLFLVSGGASSMMESPLDPDLSAEDVGRFHRVLVASGLPIAQMNTLRKHFSLVKGGRLALAARQARIQSTLLISDVPCAHPDAVGSGPSLPDPTTLDEVAIILPAIAPMLPSRVAKFFLSPACVETPKPDNPAFQRAHWTVLLSSDDLAAAAAASAREQGFRVLIDNGCDEWDYRDAARYLLDRSQELARDGGKTCVISVGEVGVSLSPSPGIGGRNQQFVAFCATELARRGQSATILSAGSDGIDGTSTAAGAICDERTTEIAAERGVNLDEALAAFNTSPALEALDALVTTGRTGNNLRDIRCVYTEPSAHCAS